MNTQIKGENQVRKFRQAAERIVSNIAIGEDIAGVVFLGGLTRGFADRYSDVDLIVFLNKRDESVRRNIRNVGLEEQKRSGLDIDLEIHCVSEFDRRMWNETDRWDFSHAKIVSDPRGHIKKMFEAKLKVPERFWTKRIVTCAEYMKWYCCPPKENVGTIAEAWVDRGDLLSAHYCLNYAVDLLLDTVFSLNREFLPPPKWKTFYFFSLKWLPENHKLLKEAMRTGDFTLQDLRRRLKTLRKVWKKVLVRIEEQTGLASGEISRWYVQKVLHQTEAPEPT